jgi:UPF0176 protein
MAGHERITLSFYKYHRIEDPAGFRDRLFAAWDALGVLGRIYIASEGVNAQLSLPASRWEGFRAHLDGIPFLRGVRLNIAVEQNDRSFLKLKIKVRAKIVADGIEDPDFDATKVGPHLDARAFNDLIGEPDAILVDMRNHFESEIGHFRNAIRPDVDTFRDSLGVIENGLKAHKESKTLVMYCTGGIRCEKASAYFLHKGFRSVYQLEGGIIEYLRQVKAGGLENKFMGKNFVFDSRMAERISADVVSACHQCGSPNDTQTNCGNPACHVLFIQCPSCFRRMLGCCSEKCRDIAALPEATQRELRKGRKAEARYFKRMPVSGSETE